MRFLLLPAMLVVAALSRAEEAATLVADGFDFPVGKPEGEGYYKARGYRPNGHLGEDWNGKRGGDSDLGDPVWACANGLVVFAQNFGHGWGNVVIVRHVYEEGGRRKFADSLYGHLDKILCRAGQNLRRGQQLGTIGTGGGHYDAHLHFEMRKELRVGMARHRFPRDARVYWDPSTFIAAHRKLAASTVTAMVPVNTFAQFDANAIEEVQKGFLIPGAARQPAVKPGWKPKRYEDIRR